MASRRQRVVRLLTLGLLVACAAPLGAVDGVVLIDQNRALAGGVTPGDAPGFPVTITTSGSFRLSSNLTVPNANTTAIDITGTANTVTIDLNGFAVTGGSTCDVSIPPACAPQADDPANVFGSGTGIRSLASATLTVKNGVIRGMGRYALFVAGAPLVLVDGLEVRDNAFGGLFLGIGNITNSVVSRNGGHGIWLNQGVIKGNLITRNANSGILSTGLQLVVLENTIIQNGGYGIDFGATGAYAHNIMSSNLAGAVNGSGVQTAGNVCNGAPCP